MATQLNTAHEAMAHKATGQESAVNSEASVVSSPHAPHRPAVERSRDAGLSSAVGSAAPGSAAPAEQTLSTSGTERVGAESVSLTIEEPWLLGLDWPVVAWIAVVHVGALAAPFFFTWKAVALCAFLCWLMGSIGVCMGYHRYLTHGSFSTYRPIRLFLALLGGLSGEGSAMTWVSNHRKHHVFSDKKGDPHSPRDGRWWSHMLWFMPDFGHKYHRAMAARYAPDLDRDPVMRFLHKFFLPSHVLMGGLLFAIGYFGWNAYTGWSFVVWGMFVRLVYVLHVTWFVNSATHIWGYRNYETSDNSRNLWWVGILAFGEGWHNNHHAFQRMARQGHRWWEIDMTYWAICVLEKLHLAWNVQHEIPQHGQPE